jgi:hypothetical protein
VTEVAVQRAGENRGIDAAYGATLVGSLGGMVAGAAVGFTPVLFAPRTEVACLSATTAGAVCSRCAERSE